uniref:Ribonuclease A-domain domain-containing protein n=1 Tax=Sander lucioperca TaxID=283035 RepID=A0A8C9YW70_SANLU
MPDVFNAENPVDKFKNQHINEEMDDDSGTEVIDDRAITDENGNCKLTNTFIKAKFTSVKHVCGTGGQKYINENKPDVNNLRESRAPFNIVVCRLTDATVSPCEYNGADYNRYIVVPCDVKGDPVLFEKSY